MSEIMSQPLHSLVINLTAQEDGRLPGSVGELAHAAFYAIINAVDPQLASAMHDAQERKAFTLSPLYGYRPSDPPGQIRVNRGQGGWLRLGLLDPMLFVAFTRHLLTQRQPAIRLANTHFSIHEVLGAPESHPWAGYTTLQTLNEIDSAPNRWTLEFVSPTAVRWGNADNGTRRVEIFPLPRMVIAGLRTRWDRMTGQDWGVDFEDWVERNVVVGRIWRWETQPFLYKQQRYVGGCGKLEYHLLDAGHHEYAVHLHRLLNFAFYAGVGYKTTHGMGQVRLQ